MGNVVALHVDAYTCMYSTHHNIAWVAIRDHFIFHSYKHWAMLVITYNNGTRTLIYSQQGVYGYAMGLVSLTQQLKTEFPMVEQPWYANNVGEVIIFWEIHAILLCLTELGPEYGYCPDP
jgi:hypothetical protein